MRWLRREVRGSGVAVGGALFLVACANSAAPLLDPTTPSLLDPSQPRTDPLVTITSSGVSPLVSHLDQPVTVTFVNRDGAPHRMVPAPELGYGSCAEIAGLGPIDAGESRSITISRSSYVCAFKDDGQPANRAFQGFLVVH